MSASRAPLLGFHEGRRAAERTRLPRRAAGLTLDDLAAKLGCSRSWLGPRERGEVRLSVAEAERIAQALGTDLARLTEGDAA